MQNKIYIIDFDSTLSQCETLDELANIALENNSEREKILKQISEITTLAMSGEIKFEEGLKKRLKLFQANKDDIEKLIKFLETKISPSAINNKNWFSQNRENIFLISGGFEDYILPVAEKLNIKSENIVANNFLFDKQGYICGFDETCPLSRSGGKADQVKKMNLSAEKVVIIGDGYNDFEVKQSGAADEFWAFTETVKREKVTKNADKIVKSFDEVIKLSQNEE